MKEEIAMKSGALAVSGFSGWLAFFTVDLPLAIFGVPFGYLFAGFAGAVLALGMLPPMPRWKMLIVVASGTLAAAWLVLPLTELLGLAKPYPGYAFVLGLVFHLVITLIFSRAPALLDRVLDRWLPGRAPP